MSLAEALTLARFEAAWRRVAEGQDPSPRAPPVPLERLRAAVLGGCYHPGALRRRVRAKPDGGERLLGIPPLEDRVVQVAVLDAVHSQVDGLLSPRVHGYRRGRGVHTALEQLLREARHPRGLWVVQADVASMFDTLPLPRVQRAAQAAVQDPLWSRLVGLWLGAWATAPGVGVPQGAPLSPLLANLTLAEAVDQHLEARATPGVCAPLGARLAHHRRVLAQALGGGAGRVAEGAGLAPAGLLTWIRYGDDVVMVTAERGLEHLRRLDALCRAAGLALGDRKTACTGPRSAVLPRPVLGVPLRFVRDVRGWRLERAGGWPAGLNPWAEWRR